MCHEVLDTADPLRSDDWASPAGWKFLNNPPARRVPLMTHAYAPPTGRLRMVQFHLHNGIPQAHVAAEFRVFRPTVASRVA